MATYANVQVKLSANADGTVNVQVGPETYTVERKLLVDMIRGLHKSPECLVHQAILGLDAAGFDPATATAAQLKAAIEALTLKW